LCLAAQLSEALLAADEAAEASQLFHEDLRLAASAGIYQTILDEGPEIGTLLLRFQENARRTGVSGDLLATFARSASSRISISRAALAILHCAGVIFFCTLVAKLACSVESSPL
jgi:hypothetical protein